MVQVGLDCSSPCTSQEWLSVYLSSPRQQHKWRLPVDDMSTRFRRYLLLIILACAVGVTLIVFMTRVGRGIASRDPNLDWRLNHQIKIGGE